MARYCVIVAKDRGGVIATAADGGWTLVEPIRPFSGLDTEDDGSLGPHIGRLFTSQSGYVALAYREAE